MVAVEQFYKPQEVADKLSISVFTVKEFLRDGKLRGQKIAGAWRVPESAVAEFLAAADAEDDK